MNTISKLLGTTVIALASGSVSAAPFYIDNGVNYAPDTAIPTKVNATSTSVKDEMTFKYQSSTNFDFGANGVLNVGDNLVTKGGLAVGPVAQNMITSLNPGQVGPFGLADNGYLANWLIAFSFTDLKGTVTGFQGAFPLLDYDSGTINLLYSTNFGASYTNFMDLIVTDSNLTGGANLEIVGNIDFTNVDNLNYADLFHDAATGTSFYDTWLAGGSTALTFSVDQNTNPDKAKTTAIANGVNITSDHDGSVTFAVPEPSSLALLGLGLMGFSRYSRRNA